MEISKLNDVIILEKDKLGIPEQGRPVIPA